MRNKALIEELLHFIAARQEKDGSFLSLSSPHKENFEGAKKYRSIFSTALIAFCLDELKNENLAKSIQSKAIKFLLSQKSEHWSFNYWARNSQESKTMPYPDDLDDTFCALSAIYKHNPKIIDGAALAKIVAILTATEKKEGGPYRTWLVPENSPEIWRDIDIAVNSNIAYFLSLQEVELENIIAFIEKAIAEKKFFSPYYPSEYPVIYFISRWYKGGKVKEIIKFILSKKTSNNWGNPLNTALAINSLINFGMPSENLKKEIDCLINNLSSGKIESFAFCIDPAIGGKTYYSGSPALTAAFCLEALAKSDGLRAAASGGRSSAAKPKEKQDKKELTIYNKIIAAAKKRFSALGPDLKKQSLKYFNEIIEKSVNKQITLLPYFFRKALGKKGEKISDEFIINLGVVNAYGWLAYTIYDNFLDDEGESIALSVANFCLRELSLMYTDVILNESAGWRSSEESKIFNKIMSGIDSANSWELEYCRGKINGNTLTPPDPLPDYKNYSKLAERSLGHALGPVAILLTLGYKQNSKEIKNVLAFFRHYIIARQLNDDAHDWEEDLKKGHISAANTLLLKKLGKTGKKIDLKKDLPDLQSIYWSSVILDICDEILKQIKKAKEVLDSISIIENKSILEKMLEPIESSARTAIAQQQKTSEFLENYETK